VILVGRSGGVKCNVLMTEINDSYGRGVCRREPEATKRTDRDALYSRDGFRSTAQQITCFQIHSSKTGGNNFKFSIAFAHS